MTKSNTSSQTSNPPVPTSATIPHISQVFHRRGQDGSSVFTLPPPTPVSVSNTSQTPPATPFHPATTNSQFTPAVKLPPPATDDEIKDRELWELELIMVARHEQNKALYAAAHKEAMEKWRQDGANWKRL